MCVICRKEYNENTTVINCDFCTTVTEIPILPNLQKLYCCYTNITEIPILPNLQKLNCTGCPWLEKSYDFKKRIKKLIILQRLWRNKRFEKYQEFLPVCNDVKKYIIKSY